MNLVNLSLEEGKNYSGRPRLPAPEMRWMIRRDFASFGTPFRSCVARPDTEPSHSSTLNSFECTMIGMGIVYG
jgi:hypothetical protein